MMGNLYFVAIIPPPAICDAITAIKQDFKTWFSSAHALRLIPHITLKAPFTANDDQYVKKWFEDIVSVVPAFEQRLNNFGCFAGKRNPVIFIEPVLGDELKQLQNDVITGFRKNFPAIPVPQNELNFHPHITVGYRDLSYDQFKLAWDEYKEKTYQEAFMVENFCLLQHDRKLWNIIAAHSLGEQTKHL